MSNSENVETGCVLVGEYIDEGHVPESLNDLAKAPLIGQVERPRVVANFLELWSKRDSEKEFTVLLCDQRVVTVRGHAVKFVPNVANPQDHGSYGIVLHVGDQEVMVGLFRVVEVKGIFSGDLAPARESA
jgi:hypothetical protein